MICASLNLLLLMLTSSMATAPVSRWRSFWGADHAPSEFRLYFSDYDLVKEHRPLNLQVDVTDGRVAQADVLPWDGDTNAAKACNF